MAIEYGYYTIKPHALLSFQAIVGYEKVGCSCKAKERKPPPQMMMAGAITSGIERWQWGQLLE